MKFRKIIHLPRQMLWALVMETIETKQMLQTYARHGRGLLLVKTKKRKPTEEEMQKAMEQLKDIPRILPFFMLVIAPVPGVTEGYVLMAVTLEKWLGQKVRLLPSQFRDVFHKKEHKPEQVKEKHPAGQ